MMVISLLGVFAIAAASLVNSMLDKYRYSRVTQQLIELHKKVSDRYSAQGSYLTLSNSVALSENLVPYDMINGANIQHRLGGSVTVSGTSRETFRIVFNSLSRTACMEIAALNWVMNDTTELKSIKFSSGKKFEWKRKDDVVIDGNFLPITTSIAIDNCATNSNNSIEWEFY